MIISTTLCYCVVVLTCPLNTQLNPGDHTSACRAASSAGVQAADPLRDYRLTQAHPRGAGAKAIQR